MKLLRNLLVPPLTWIAYFHSIGLGMDILLNIITFLENWLMNLEESSEQRSEQRVAVSLPVTVENTEAVTRDISVSGICFEATGLFNLGEIVRFAVEFDNQGSGFMLNCRGEIVRLVQRQEKVDVSVKILDSVLNTI